MSRPRRVDPADIAAKQQFIAAYFDDLRARAYFAGELRDDGHGEEAMTLCCCYIDGLANFLYHDSDRSAFNFVRLLREHGHQPDLMKACPVALTGWLGFNHPKLAPLARKLSAGLGGDHNRIMSEPQLTSEISRLLTRQEASALSSHTWRASLAFIAYTHLRRPSVHATGSSSAVIIGSGGPSIPVRISFDTMHSALLAIIDDLHDLSLRTNKWFGHDKIL